MGEGGAILINNEKYIEKAEILREKGTNRTQFYRGQVAKYNWVDFGDSYLQSDLNAAYLWAQLEMADQINENRLKTWDSYWKTFKPYADTGKVILPTIPEGCMHNAHMFYLKFADLETRQRFIDYMKENEILTVFHYVPLHSSKAGLLYSEFRGEDKYTTKESERLLRLPMYYKLTDEDLDEVVTRVKEYYKFT